ncbi:unnamed protein product [Prorocentrum cordatum]|uniref:Uncharacterized protein n=1 Tax=Prorocentrum cordatum TaxID=2364126 RepID=A0ABN9V9A5_9DINO|nr:unnamed protein product [Polarella glacialis]
MQVIGAAVASGRAKGGDWERGGYPAKASAAGANQSLSGRLLALRKLASEEALCSDGPEWMAGTAGVRSWFDRDLLEAAVSAGPGGVYAGYLQEVCLPAQLALDLLCSQHARLEGRRGRALAARRMRRLGVLLPLVAECLVSSLWPMEPADLRAYLGSWEEAVSAAAGSREPPEVPPFEALVLPRPLEQLDERVRRCLPLQRAGPACWQREAASLLESCTRCCNPAFPRGQRACFSGGWSFEACCNPDVPGTSWPPPPEAVEELVARGPASGGGAPPPGRGAAELRELRRELREACPPQFGAGDKAPRSRAAAWAELQRWLATARAQPHGLQRAFPELDMLVSTKACVSPETELPWFVLAGGDPQEEAAASGVELAVAMGAVCGPGVPVAGELVAHAGERVTVPCRRPPGGPEPRHRLEPYGLELMHACRLAPQGGCGCGTVWCPSDPGGCCREGANVEWRGVGLLTGELRTNIAHFARDALWLHLHLRGNASLAALGVESTGGVEVVLTKHAATECLENGQCVKTGRDILGTMESFLAEVALRDAEPAPRVLHTGDPERRHPICFETVAQRWRPWAGDGHSIGSFRAKALDHCSLRDLGLQRKVLVVLRDASSRQWSDQGALQEQLGAFARSIGSSLHAVYLGWLEPCEQVRVLHDAMLMVAIHGADLTGMIFLPQGAAVVEVAVECELEGGSVDSPFWRGPGTHMNSSVFEEAVDAWRRDSAAGRCPAAGATDRRWLQGFPVSQFAKLARQANLLYTAVMDCSESDCPGRQMGDVWDRGWCTAADVKKRRFVDVDIEDHLVPTLWAIFDGYLRWRAPPN